jgi:hypothetical protein
VAGAHFPAASEVRKVPIADIDLRHVIADGDESVAEWRDAHC